MDVLENRIEDVNRGEEKTLGQLTESLLNASRTTAESIEVLICEKARIAAIVSDTDLRPDFLEPFCQKLQELFSDVEDYLRNSARRKECTDVHNRGKVYEEAIDVILEYLELCVMSVFSNTQSVDAKFVSNVFPVVLKVVRNSFYLYKDLNGSGSTISWDILFNKAVSLTKAFISSWEKTNVDVKIEDDCNLVVKVCDDLNEVCSVLSAITMKPAISVWKCYTSTLLKYCDGIKDRVDVASAIKSICQEISAILTGITNSDIAKDGTVMRSLQTCRFFCKILMALCDRYKFFLGDCFLSLLHLLIMLYGYSVQDFNSLHKLCEPLFTKVEENVTVVTEPLTDLLLNEIGFLSTLVGTDVALLDVHHYFPYCLLLLYTLERFSTFDGQYQELLLNLGRRDNDGRVSILKIFFDTFSKCSLELLQPVYLRGIMCQGKPQRLVSFYEYACTKLCSFVTVLPPQYFSNLEQILAKNLLSDMLWSQLLVTDVWAYLARLESPDLCLQHFRFVAHIVDALNIFENCNFWCISFLCKRLFHFLAEEHKILITKEFFMERHPRLWACLVQSHLSEELVNYLGGRANLVSKCLTELEGIIANKGSPSDSRSSMDILEHMYYSLLFLTEFYSQDVGNSCSSKLLDVSIKLLLAVEFEHVPGSNMIELIVSQIIQLLCSLVSLLQTRDFLEILPKLIKFQRCRSDIVRLSITAFLEKLKSKQFQLSTDVEILSLLSTMWSNSLLEENAVLLHHSLCSFSEFSHNTPHTCIITKCFVQNPVLKQMVVNFFNQVPYGNFDYKELLKNQCQSHIESNHHHAIANKEDKPQNKISLRDRDESYKSATQKIKKDIAALRALSTNEAAVFPRWLKIELETIITDLTNFRDLIS